MHSCSASASEVVTTEGSVTAFMEILVDPLLPLKPSEKANPLDEQQQALAKQIHAVVLLYNYYQRKRHPELEFLKFESFCKLAATLRPSMIPYIKCMHQSDYKVPEFVEDQLSLTEKAIMDACKLCLALDVPEDVPVKEWPISKVVVLLVDSSKENCALIFGSVTQGAWSFLEQSIDNCKISLESTVARNKRRRINKNDSGEEQNAIEAGHEQLAFSAIKESTGIKKTELVFLESHVVYSLSKEKTAVRFYSVKCTGEINKTLRVPIKEVLESLQGPLVEKMCGCWTATRVAENLHLLPYAGILSNYFSSDSSLKQASHEGGHQRTGGDKSQASQELSHGHQRTIGVNSQSFQEFPPDTENMPPVDFRKSESQNENMFVEQKDYPDMHTRSEVSSGCLDDLEVMVSTSTSKINEASDATIKSPKRADNDGTGMAGQTWSVSRLHGVEIDQTVAVSTHKEDKMKNARMSGKVYQHNKKRTLTGIDCTFSTLGVKDKKVAAVIEVEPTTGPEFKTDKLGIVNKSCNNISMKQDKLTIGDGALVSFQMNTNSLEKVQSTFAAKEKELSVAASRVLLSKKDRLTHQLWNLRDEIAICDNNIHTILNSGNDDLALKIDTLIDCCNDVCVERKEVQDGTCQHVKEQVSFQQLKGCNYEAVLCEPVSCEVLDHICYDKQWTLPTYSVSPFHGGYLANVTIKGGDFEWLVNGSEHSSPDIARDSAAACMIDNLNSLACQNK